MRVSAHLDSNRFQRLASTGARAQRLLFASTGTKDKGASDTLYVDGLAAPNTINTIPETTLHAFAGHGSPSTTLSRDGSNSEAVLAAHSTAGVDLPELASTLQSDGARAFVRSWDELLTALDAKSSAIR